MDINELTKVNDWNSASFSAQVESSGSKDTLCIILLPYLVHGSAFKTVITGTREVVSAVESTYCSSRTPEFGSQYLYQVAYKHMWLPFQGSHALCPLLAPALMYCMYHPFWYTHTCIHIYTHACTNTSMPTRIPKPTHEHKNKYTLNKQTETWVNSGTCMTRNVSIQILH